MHGKCPKCEQPVLTAKISIIQASVPMGKQWKTIAFCCESCLTVLGVQIDSIAIRTDLINALKQ